MLQEPFVYDNEGVDPLKVQQGMKKEAQSMKTQGVFPEMNYNDVPEEHKYKVIESKWVSKPKQEEARCRIAAKGYLETIQDLDNIYASTPIFGILRILLTMAQHNHWTIQAGDVSTAFLHAPAPADNLYMWPPPELYPSGHNTTTAWKLNKAIYGLRSSPKSWQDHFAQVLQQMGLSRLTSEPNVYRNNEQTMFVMVYVDDLLFLGQQQEVDKTFKEVQKHVLLRPTGTLGIGQTIQFLGRDVHNNGDFFEVSLKPEYITTLLKETKMEASNPASAPGTATLKQSTNDDAPLDAQEHADYRRAVGKLDLHKTRHQLCNKRTGTRPTTTNTARPTQGEAPSTIPQGNTTLQNDPEDNTHTTNKGTHRPQHLCRCGLGRVPKHKKINKWVHRDNDGIRSTIWKQNTSSSSYHQQISELYAVGTGAQEGQLHQGSNNNKGEHSHTHRQAARA